MSAIVIISILVGAVLGRKLPVLVLVPAMIVGLPMTFAVALTSTGSLGSAFWTSAFVAFGLQGGYVAGFLITYLLVISRTSRSLSVTTTAARSRP